MTEIFVDRRPPQPLSFLMACSKEPLVVDCDAFLAQRREELLRETPDFDTRYAWSNERDLELNGKTLLALEYGLYDLEGVLLRPRTPKLVKEITATLTLRIGARRITKHLVGARMYPNKKSIKAVATQRQQWHSTIALYLDPAARETVHARIDWAIWPHVLSAESETAGQRFHLDTTIIPPSSASPIAVMQSNDIVHSGYAGNFSRDGVPDMLCWDAPSLIHAVEKVCNSGGYVVDLTSVK